MGYWKSWTVPAKKAPVLGAGYFVNRPVPGAIGPVIYGGTDVIWSTVYQLIWPYDLAMVLRYLTAEGQIA